MRRPSAEGGTCAVVLTPGVAGSDLLENVAGLGRTATRWIGRTLGLITAASAAALIAAGLLSVIFLPIAALVVLKD